MRTDCFPVEKRNCQTARKFTGSSRDSRTHVIQARGWYSAVCLVQQTSWCLFRFLLPMLDLLLNIFNSTSARDHGYLIIRLFPCTGRSLVEIRETPTVKCDCFVTFPSQSTDCQVTHLSSELRLRWVTCTLTFSFFAQFIQAWMHI